MLGCLCCVVGCCFGCLCCVGCCVEGCVGCPFCVGCCVLVAFLCVVCSWGENFTRFVHLLTCRPVPPVAMALPPLHILLLVKLANVTIKNQGCCPADSFEVWHARRGTSRPPHPQRRWKICWKYAFILASYGKSRNISGSI